jgi:hypothetical protein
MTTCLQQATGFGDPKKNFVCVCVWCTCVYCHSRTCSQRFHAWSHSRFLRIHTYLIRDFFPERDWTQSTWLVLDARGELQSFLSTSGCRKHPPDCAKWVWLIEKHISKFPKHSNSVNTSNRHSDTRTNCLAWKHEKCKVSSSPSKREWHTFPRFTVSLLLYVLLYLLQVAGSWRGCRLVQGLQSVSPNTFSLALATTHLTHSWIWLTALMPPCAHAM